MTHSPSQKTEIDFNAVFYTSKDAFYTSKDVCARVQGCAGACRPCVRTCVLRFIQYRWGTTPNK